MSGALVDGVFHEMKRPMAKRTVPCSSAVDGSTGKASKRTAVKGTAIPVHTWATMMRPVSGNQPAILSPIQPPKRPPIDPATMKNAMMVAVLPCEKPMSSSHIGANENVDHANAPTTASATMIWNVFTCRTRFASSNCSLRSSMYVVRRALWTSDDDDDDEEPGSSAKK
ncbi:hypothetical protein Mapa_011265 [Marchantia paleacea]|nr:hypothetical protein Mapa_011265 [Marchantia paleacea]